MEICCSWVEWPLPTRSIKDDPDGLSRLLADPEFEVLVEMRHADYSHIGFEYETALQAMNEILNAIDHSLSEPAIGN